MSNYKLCFLIPVYNHGATAHHVVATLRKLELAIILIDDASNQETKRDLADIARADSLTYLYTLEYNRGKGGAVTYGLQKAAELGFTHALQVDADGQHDLSVLNTFIEASIKNPLKIIAGKPEYDQSVPKSRKIGRKITNFWVAIETLSGDISDAMCGFRIYPLASTVQLLNRKKLGWRMEFDIEILVRLHWQGVRYIFFPIHVIYPEGGISHFNMVKDNIAISRMHCILFFGMVFRFPYLIAKRIFSNTSQE